MSYLVPAEVQEYALRQSVPESPLLRRLAAETRRKMEDARMMVGPLEGAFLQQLVRLVRAHRLLEIGTFTGYSALWMAAALPARGRLITCDIDPETTKIAKRYWQHSPHGAKIELRLGPALETLDRLRGTFDLVFIDADKGNYIKYWEACVPKVRREGLLVADNTLRGGRVLQAGDPQGRVMDAFNRHVRSDRRVGAILLPIRDGVTVAWKI